MNNYSQEKQNSNRKKRNMKRGIALVFAILFLIMIAGTFIWNAKKDNGSGAAEAVIATETELPAETEAVPGETEELLETEAGVNADTEISTELESSANTGYTISNSPIAEITSISNELYNWGSGGGVDELNRPVGCLMYMEKFSSYPADFIQDTTEKVIYLTFDEGYEYGHTPKILDTLEEKDCPAVFFVTKPFAESEPDLIQRMIDGGFIIGNHSVTHPADGLPSETLDEQTAEVMDMHNYMVETYDYSMCLFRYPAGKFSEQSLALMNNLNYRAVFWSFAYLDYNVDNQPEEEASLQKMVDALHPGAIYLLHGVSQTNADVLGRFIDEARGEGYRFASYADVLD